MKKINLYILALSVMLPTLFSCEEELLDQVNPNAVTTGSYWKTEEDFEKALNATYGALQYTAVSGTDLSKLIVRSDLGGTESWYGLWTEFNDMRWTDGTPLVKDRWDQLYVGVYRTNQMLDFMAENGAGIADFTETEREQTKAQARFLRAYYYFLIAHTYGQAVIHTTVPQTPDDRHVAPSSIAEVMEQVIVPDLEYAASVLPQRWSGDDLGRATWGAAIALLGKAYLYVGEYDKAAVELKKVIDEADKGLYSLDPNFMNNFTVDGEHNSESIFEVGFSDNYKAGVNGNVVDDTNGVAGAEAITLASAFADIKGAGGYNTAMPTYWVQELFLVADKMDLSNPINTDKAYSTRTYATIAVEFGDGDYYNAPLTGDDSKINFSFGQASKIKKYTNWDRADFEDSALGARTGINLRVIRLADVYLMYAEALLSGSGNLTEAISYIDKVRTRAGVITLAQYMADNSNQIPVMDKSTTAAGKDDFDYTPATKEAVLHHLRMVERPLELAFEGHRWYDLARWDINDPNFSLSDWFKERSNEYTLLEEVVKAGFDATTPVEPIYIRERFRNDFINPATNYKREAHNYLPLPVTEVQTNQALSGAK